ncbi:MAG: hypothetical protein IJ960_00110 [Oscillospiraceae bacterium]|nr:hypothetical protein [Oscillospiraceae bacterium]
MKKVSLKLLLQYFRSESLSLQKRFLLYIISAIATFLALAMVLLNLFGFVNSANVQIMRDLDTWLANSADSIERDCDELAACAISFSHQLEHQIQNFLIEHQLQFDGLRDNTQALTALQQQLYDTVYLNMQVAPASGIFYLLNTTVNSASETPLFNGIYLKYVNLSSENTVNNDFALYRGSYTTGKEHNLTFHSGWNNENRTDFFVDCESVFSDGVHYALSSVVEIPETWENARYIYVPLRDRQGTIIGVCGFEISDLLFRLSYKTEDIRWGQLVCGLIDRQQGDYFGQFNSNRYQTGNSGSSLRIISKPDCTQFDFGTESCVGTARDIFLGNDTFTVAMMMPQAQYQKFIRTAQLQNAAIFLILGTLTLVCCVILSHKYVSPILKRIEQVKANEIGGDPTNIREIEDLFAYLAARDEAYEARLEELEKERQAAEANATQTQKDYQTALRQLDLVQGELEQLAAAQHREIVLEEYEFFLCNLGTLTATEYKVYELYLAGKNAKQIAQLLGISENTLKYHNKNIYSKLGISSRKQMLRFAALKQHQDAHAQTT